MSQTLLNSGAGQANGTTATQGSGGNTGGTSGNYFDTLTKGTGSTITFANTHPLHTAGINNYNFTTPSTATTVTAKWIASITDTPTQAWFRIYLWLVSLPSSNMIIHEMLDTSGNAIGGIEILTTGKVRRLNAALGTIGSDTTTELPTGQWNRLEGYFISSASNGGAEVKVYTTADSCGAATETQTTATGQAMNGNDIARALYGINTSLASTTIFMGSLGWTDLSYLGPDATCGYDGYVRKSGVWVPVTLNAGPF